MKKRLWMAALVLFVLLTIVVLATPGAEPPGGSKEFEVLNSTLMITEVCAKNESVIADNDGKFRDYIELYNSGEPVSLKGFTFYDGKIKSEPMDDIVLETGEYRVFFISRSNTGFALGASGGDTVQLLNSAGKIVAQTNTALLGTDEVMLYINGNYSNSYEASPGFSNDAKGRKLFVEGNPVQELPLAISEVLLRNVSTLPDEMGAYSDMVELCNISDSPIALDRYFLSDDVQDRFAYRLPQYTLEPGAMILLCCDGENYISAEGVIHTNFGLSNAEPLVLTNHTGDYISLQMEYPGDDLSIFRDADGAYIVGRPSLGYRNTQDGIAALENARINVDAPLAITEVLLSSAGVPYQGTFCDVVEITNVSDETVATAGWYLSDGGDPYEYLLPECKLATGESMVIRCGVQTTGFSLSDGEILRLTAPDYRHAPLIVCEESEYGKSICQLGSGEEASYAYMDITLGYPNDVSFHEQYLKDQLIGDLRISEVMSGNGSYLKGPYGTTCDWIELYNASDESIALSDYFLTDSKGNLKKYPLPDMVLGAGEYGIILLSDDTMNLPEGYAVLAMTLAVDGESLYLSKDSTIVDYMLLPSVPYDMSYGRQPGSAGQSLLQNPTPGRENSGKVEISAAPVALTAQGCYDGVEYVDVVLEGEGDIYYTTNCYDPTMNSKRYTGPIRLTETTILRVMCYENGKIQSQTVDLTYIINANDNLPVISIVTDPDNLWSETKGIYVKGDFAAEEVPHYGANYWMGWEKPASISLFETDGGGFSLNCGIKIFGNYSRIQEKKSLSCLFRSKYGYSQLEYPLFGEDGLDTYESFILRSSGQDAVSARMRDVLNTSLVADYTDVPVQDYRPVILYLDGQYWGLYYIREKLNEHYLAGHYNTESENMAVVYPSDEKKRDYWALMEFVRNNDMAIPENYEYVCSKMDVDNYIDFIIAQMWIANTDMVGNVKYFLNPEGKWTWILFDTDITLSKSYENMLELIFVGTNDVDEDVVDRNFAVGLIRNPEFREKFLTRMAWQMNTIWTEENVIGRVDEIAAIIGPDMENETTRWSDGYDHWLWHLDIIRQFARERSGYMLMHIKNYFDLTDEQMRSYGFNV